ncbi:MAG TPA: hypothetical protein VL125_16310 [Pelobium sp.]|nr:hypothetical protein [Pelobium sp.]
MKSLFAVFLFVAVFTQNYCKAQSTEVSTIQANWNNYLQNNFQEKLYVHTDKNSYLAGEIIWFKIYNVEAFTNRPVDISKVAYIEVLDAENKPVLQAKITLKDGKGEGSLYIPIALQSGAYSIRSYTNWMKNFDARYYFSKAILIYNTLNEEHIAEKKKSGRTFSMQFFPEGGNLVYGLTSKVAFKAVDNAGKSFDFNAVLLNLKNDTIATFSPHKFGLGSFSFKPEKGETYKVSIAPTNGKSFIATLPRIFEHGVVMAVKQNSDTALNFSITNNLVQNQKFTLFVHSGQKEVFVKALDTKNSLDIPLGLLGDGISRFTLFDEVGNAVCERLYFKKPKKILKLDLSVDKELYNTREKVRLSMSSKSTGLSEKADFSVAVYQTDSLETSEDIATNLWLTSELKGKVENANFYLNGASPAEIDNLMLTHGWTRFKWEDILANKNQEYKYTPEIDGHIISGKITNSLNGQSSANHIAFLSVLGQGKQLYTATSTAKGEINFYTKQFYGSHDIVAQTDFRLDSQVVIDINSPYSNKFAEEVKPEFSYSSAPSDLLKRSIAMQVNNAFNTRYLNREIISSLDSSFFYDRPEKIYKLDDYVRFSTMEEVLREYVTEIMVNLRKKDYQLSIFDSGIKQFHSTAPLTLLDGVPVFDEGNSIIKVDPRKIQRLELITDSYSYGRNTFAGIANFISYKGDLAGYQLPKKALLIDYDGLQNKREFYAPMYDGDTAKLTRIPDYRTTLFWSSSNQTSTEGKSELTFYTSDMEGSYVINVQAISKNGASGSATAHLKVVKNQ